MVGKWLRCQPRNSREAGRHIPLAPIVISPSVETTVGFKRQIDAVSGSHVDHPAGRRNIHEAIRACAHQGSIAFKSQGMILAGDNLDHIREAHHSQSRGKIPPFHHCAIGFEGQGKTASSGNGHHPTLRRSGNSPHPGCKHSSPPPFDDGPVSFQSHTKFASGSDSDHTRFCRRGNIGNPPIIVGVASAPPHDHRSVPAKSHRMNPTRCNFLNSCPCLHGD